MSIFSISITIILAALLLALTIWLPLAIVRNIENGHTRRKNLAAGVEGLRLGTMLERLGEDRTHYLHRKHLVDIEKHMARCGSCEATVNCDEKLSNNDKIAAEEVTFCPNIADIR